MRFRFRNSVTGSICALGLGVPIIASALSLDNKVGLRIENKLSPHTTSLIQKAVQLNIVLGQSKRLMILDNKTGRRSKGDSSLRGTLS